MTARAGLSHHSYVPKRQVMSPRRRVSRHSAGLTGLLAAADVPLLVRLSLAHRQDDFVPGVRVTPSICSSPIPAPVHEERRLRS